MSKYAIDLGHGCTPDTGAASSYITEEKIINEVGQYVISGLQSAGHTVVLVRPSSAYSVQNSLEQRCNKSDYYNVDYYVSIHANAGGGVGTEVFTYNGNDICGASDILKGLTALGLKNRGIKSGNNLAVVRRPKAKSILIEICFIDTASDVNIYNSKGPKAFAEAIVSGLLGKRVIVDSSASTGSTNGYKVGWNQESDGRWWYAVSQWTFCKNEWKLIDNNWYYFDENGYTVTNSWRYIKDKWYYFNGDGKMQESRWAQGKCGEWYYLSDNGSMLTNSFVAAADNSGKLYYVGNDGVMITDAVFTAIDGYSYYADASGVVVLNKTIKEKYVTDANGRITKIKNYDDELGNKIVEIAKRYIGVDYVYGGSTPEVGFDCSGLVQYVFKEAGISISRTTYTQYYDGVAVPSILTAKPGDVLLFGTDDKNPTHVGIYIGDNRFIEAPHIGAKVRIADLSTRTNLLIIKRMI